MAKFAYSLTNASGLVIHSAVVEVTDEQTGRLLAWALATFPNENGEDGQPVQRDAAWAVRRWMEGTLAETFGKVVAWETAEAAKAAAPAPITFTVNTPT